jgi:hypothetical protein
MEAETKVLSDLREVGSSSLRRGCRLPCEREGFMITSRLGAELWTLMGDLG